jgi:alanine dehydrogenase
MIIGLPQEVKNNEFRVGLTPSNVRSLIMQGHSVLVQRDAGKRIGFTDDMYRIACQIKPSRPNDDAVK